MLKSSDYFQKHFDAASKVSDVEIDRILIQLQNAMKDNHKVFVCGNGGSALTASHYVTDWSKMLWSHKNQKLQAYCLNDNIGLLSAYANDISYNEVFSNLLNQYASKNDILITISGSGNSENLVNALNVAKLLKLVTIGIVGFDGGKIKKMTDICIHYPVNDMQIAEDLHMSLGHILMKKLCSD